ncbi:MAG: dTDP-glucose 4,6-dehydratase [Fimbriimonas sp.]
MPDANAPSRAPQRVLVTGGSGFIGSNLLIDLVTRHPEIRFVNLDALTYAANPRSLDPIEGAANYGFERVDLVDADAVRETVRRVQPDLVLHLAAESHVDRSILGPRRFMETNVMGTLNLLEACREIWTDGSGRFHHVSTDEVYGSLGEEGKFTETTPYSPRSPYSASKASSDHIVRAYHETFGLDVTITNCSNNYGPRHNPEKLLPLTLLRALAREPIPIYGTGGNVRDWLYVTDHARAIWRVATAGKGGETYNVGGNAERTNLEVVRALFAALSEATGTAVEEFEALITYVKDRPGHDWRYAIDASKIQNDLGWEPEHTLESGLRATVRWYLGNPDWIEAARSQNYDEWVKAQYVAGGRA